MRVLEVKPKAVFGGLTVVNREGSLDGEVCWRCTDDKGRSIIVSESEVLSHRTPEPEPKDEEPTASEPEPKDEEPTASEPEPKDEEPTASEPEPKDNPPQAVFSRGSKKKGGKK
jgi:hypothetical protein